MIHSNTPSHETRIGVSTAGFLYSRMLFAKSFIERCPDIAFLSDLLGHESLETTRIYLRRTSTEQQQIVNKIVNW